MRLIEKVIRKLAIGLMLLVAVGFLTWDVFAAPKDDHEHDHGHDHGEKKDESHDSHKEHDSRDRHDDHENEGGHGGHSEAKPVEFTMEVLARYGISVEKAGAALIKHPLHLNGRVIANEDRLIHIVPRFSGIAKEIEKRLGDRVKKGEVMAVIESNQSLQPYEVKSSIDGTVIFKHISPGELVAESDHIYVVADLGEVWVDLYVFEPDFGKLKIGQTVLIKAGDREISSKISFVSLIVEESTQSKFVRAVLQNDSGQLYPGQFVTADLFVEEVNVPLAVRLSSIQSIESQDVVFVKNGNVFDPHPVRLGRRDNQWSEVVSGLELGAEYAAGKTFILKAEHGKSEAEHAH